MKLYVDDIREAPDESWTLCRTITEAIRLIARYKNEIKEISLDHDISFDVRVESTYRPFPSPENFTALAYFIGEVYYINRKFDTSEYAVACPRTCPKITAHTANPVGAENLKRILEENYGIPVEIKMMQQAHRKK